MTLGADAELHGNFKCNIYYENIYLCTNSMLTQKFVLQITSLLNSIQRFKHTKNTSPSGWAFCGWFKEKFIYVACLCPHNGHDVIDLLHIRHRVLPSHVYTSASLYIFRPQSLLHAINKRRHTTRKLVLICWVVTKTKKTCKLTLRCLPMSIAVIVVVALLVVFGRHFVLYDQQCTFRLVHFPDVFRNLLPKRPAHNIHIHKSSV